MLLFVQISAGGRKRQGHVKQAAKGKQKKKTGNCNLENIKHFFCMVEFLFIIIHL